MIFKYGTESVGIDFFYTDTTPFFNRGVEGLIEDIDMSIDNTKYGYAFESSYVDLDVLLNVGMEEEKPATDKPEENKEDKKETQKTSSNSDAWHKRVWDVIVNMFKTIGKWYKSAWNWIKKKFGFGGSNDVTKIAEAEIKVGGNSLAKAVDEIKDLKAMSVEDLDALVEEIVQGEISNEKSVNLKPIQAKITEEVKEQLVNVVEPATEAPKKEEPKEKEKEKNEATNAAREKLKRRGGHESETIKNKLGNATAVSVKREMPRIEFKTYLFSKRVISEFKEFKKVYASYNSTKVDISKANLNFEKAVISGAKFMSGTLMYLGALSKMLFKDINFNAQVFTNFTQNANQDTMDNMSKAADELERSLIHAVGQNQTLDLEEVVFQIKVKDNIKKELDKSTYLFEYTTPGAGVAESVAISKVISEVANKCLTDIGMLDKFVSSLTSVNDEFKRGMSRDSKARIKALRLLMSNTRNVGTNVYKLLSKSNIIKVRTTLKTDATLGENQ